MEISPQELGNLRWSKYVKIIDEVLTPGLSIAKREDLIGPSTRLFKGYLRWTWGYLAHRVITMSAASVSDAKNCVAILAIINSKQPDVVLNVLRYAAFLLNDSIAKKNAKTASHVAILFAEMYRFRIISVDMMNQIIFKLIEGGSMFSQCVLDILWQVAPALENDDYQTFSSLFSVICTKWRSKEKEIQKISVWRQQKWTQMSKNGEKKLLTYSRIPFRLNILEEEAYLTLNDFDLSDAAEDPTIGITAPYDEEKFIAAYDSYRAEIEEIIGDDDGEEESLEGDEEEEYEEEEEEVGEEEDKSTERAILEEEQKTLNLEYQKIVYLTISSTGTASECAHKLAKMMKSDDAILEKSRDSRKKKTIEPHRKILIETVIEYVGHSQSFDRNQANIVRLLCNTFDYFVPLVESYFVTVYSHAEVYKASQIINLASLYAYLLASETVSWNILSIIRLSPEDTNTEQRQFIRYLMEELAKGPSETSSQAWLIRKLSEPEVAAATAGIFLTDTYDHADIVYQFFEIIGLQFLCEGVKKKLEELSVKASAAEHEPIYDEPSDNSSSDYESSQSSSDSDSSRRKRHHHHHHHHKHHHKHHHHHRN